MPSWAIILASILFVIALIAYRLDVHLKSRRQGQKSGIEEISRPTNPKFNIVAVHGLGAHPDFSWTSKLSKRELEGDLAEWGDLSVPIRAALEQAAHKFGVTEKTRRISLLHHVLKPEFPEATILNFCYNSDWFINAPVMTAKQLGSKLLEDLEKFRSTNLSTPIIFIGHSFGGIVIKQALVAARESVEADIIDRTRAVVFLGTPHIGSRLSTVATIAAFVSGIFGSDTTLLYALKYGSEQLFELEECFRDLVKSQTDRGGKLEIISFRETMQTYVLGWLSIGLVVDASSALSCAPKTIPLNVNHVDLNKSPKIYKRLIAAIHNLTFQSKPLLNPIQREVREKLMPLGNAVFDPEREEAEEYESLCDPDTRTALLERLRKWFTSIEGENIFWLHGKAGTGKSTVSRTIVRDLIWGKQCIASFHFKRNTDSANPGQLFPTIANQLNQRLPSISKHVRENVFSPGTMSPVTEWKREEQFKKLILEPLEKIDDSEKPKTIVVVIDALDECNSQENVEKILRVLPEVKQLRSINLKFLLTSRPEDYIRAAMKRLDCWTGTAIEDESDTEHDISVFVRSRVKRIKNDTNQETAPNSQRLPQNWPSEDKISRLVKLTQPLFIFAWTACRFIKDPHISGSPDDRLEKILKQEKTGNESQIAATYLPVLEQMVYGLTDADREESIAEFKKIVGSIILLARPLSTESLAKLLQIKIEIVDRILNLLHSVLRVPSDPKLPVTVFHQLFRDFLLNSKLAREFSVSEVEVHRMLHDKCLGMMDNLKEDLCSQRKPGTLREHVNEQVINLYLKPELQYACLYWVEHLRKSNSKVDDNDHVHFFLKNHFLHWLEALGWMRKISDGFQSIVILESIAPTNESSDLFALLQDMKPFIRENQSVVELAPLQIYSSALALAPVKSKVRMQFIDTIPTWIQQVHGTSETYNRAVETLEKHDQPVEAIAFSQDGNYLASASTDGIIWLWKVETAATVAVRQFCVERQSAEFGQMKSMVENRRILDFKYSNNGKRLALSHSHGGFTLWDGESGKILRELRNKDFYVKAVAFSPDSDQLALVLSNSNIVLWNESGNEIGTLKSTDSFTGVMGVTFSEDGERLATGTRDGKLSLWVCKSRDFLSEVSKNDNSVGFDAKSRNRFYELRGIEAQLVEDNSPVRFVAFSLDNTRLVTITDKGRVICLWDGKSGAQVAALKGHGEWIISVAFSPDGKWLASSAIDSIVKLWDGISGGKLEKLTIHKLANEVIFTPDSKRLVLASVRIEIWNYESGMLLKTLQGDFIAPRALTFSPDHKRLAFSSENHPVNLWYYDTDAEITSIKHHSDNVCSVAFSQDGQRLASASIDRSIKLWDYVSGVVLKTFTGHKAAVFAVAFSPDDTWLASASHDRTIRFWDPRPEMSAKCHRIFSVSRSKPNMENFDIEANWPLTIAFSPDGKQLASGLRDGSLRLWDGESDALTVFERRFRSVDVVTFSPDGGRPASGLRDVSPRLWVGESDALTVFERRHRSVDLVAFSPDGGRLALWGKSDLEIGVWPIKNHMANHPLETVNMIPQLYFSSDGSYKQSHLGFIRLGWASNSDSRSEQEHFGLSVSKNWIRSGQDQFFYLPVEFRATCVAIRGQNIALGHNTGRVSFFRFDVLSPNGLVPLLTSE